MKFQFSHFVGIAEIFASLAVVVTLIFLVTGLRENAAITRASMYDSSIDSINQFRGLIVSDVEAARLWQAHIDGEVDSLEGLDGLRARQLVSLVFGIYEKDYFMRKNEVIGEEEWERFEFQICRQFERAQNSITLEENLGLTMTPTFLDYIDEQCAN